MKPRTKLQFRVKELSEQLPRITYAQEQWAHDECLPHLGYANKSNAFCLDCGRKFSLEIIKNKKAICPHCKQKLSIEITRKTTHKEVNYFAITHIVDEFQVVENFELIAYYKKGTPVTHNLRAILEYWINPSGKVTNIGLIHSLNYVQDSWSGGWEIREKPKNWYSKEKYNIYARKYHPDSKIKSEYRKVGIDSKLSGLSFLEAIDIIPQTPHAETLLKAKQYKLLTSFVNHNIKSKDRQYWSSIKICLRNKYKVNDATMWFDYLDLLSFFGKDLHNAKYVCPHNLKAEHDRLVAKKREHDKREELERKKQKAIEDQKILTEHIKNFIGFKITNGNITVKVLESVEEFINEGEALKHCVYVNDYHLREDALILSARIEGKPIETIEVSLKNFKIVQSRGLQNRTSEYNKKIVALVRRNIPKIKKITLQKSA